MVELWGGPLDGRQREPNVNEIHIPLAIMRTRGVHNYVPAPPPELPVGVYQLAYLVKWRHLACGVRSSWTRKIYRWMNPTTT